MPESTWWLTNLLAMASLVSLALLVSVRFNLSARESFLPTTLVAMILLYVASLAGWLQPMALAIFLVGLVGGFGLLLNQRWRSKATSVSDIKLFMALIGAFYLITSAWLREFHFIGYDEFTHWALIAKFLTQNHALPQAGGHIMFMQYAPGTALIQYFFAALASGAEPAVLFGHLTLFFACLLFLTSQTSKTMSTLAVIAWCVLATFVLRYDLSFIFVDAMLGALLAAGFFAAIAPAANPERSAFSKYVWLLAPIVAFLPLVKHVGLVLALSTIALLAVNHVLFNWQRTTGRGFLACVAHAIPSLVVLLSGVVFAYFSWKLHYQSLGIPDEYQRVLTPQNAIDFFVRPSDPTHLAVWNTFLSRMGSSVGIVSMILVLWSALLIWTANRQSKAITTSTFSVIGLGFIGYLALLLISYAFFFEGDERIHLASFERYARSYQLGWLLVLIALPTISGLWSKKVKRPWPAVALIAGCLALVVHPLARSSLFERAHIHSADHDKRVAISSMVDVINTQIPRESKIFFFDVLGDGLTWYMLRYETAGQRHIDTCWSAPARAADGSLGPPNEACEKNLQKVLDGFDYLVLFSSTDEFEKLNKGIAGGFALTAPRVYKVSNDNHGVLSIAPLQPLDNQ